MNCNFESKILANIISIQCNNIAINHKGSRFKDANPTKRKKEGKKKEKKKN